MRKRLLFVLIPVFLLLMCGAWYYHTHSGIEGQYRTIFYDWLDGRMRYIQVADGKIKSYSQLDPIDMRVDEGVIGRYEDNGDGSYNLIYTDLRLSGLTIRVEPCVVGLKIDDADIVMHDLPTDYYERLFFWSLWFK
jgi:hypothetical protein